MSRRQTIPQQWLIINQERQFWNALRRLPHGSGVLALRQLGPRDWRRLRNFATVRDLVILVEAPRKAARVHNIEELRQALLRRTPIILLSPMFNTCSHPDWTPLPAMRAAALARLANRRLIALGGMNARRYATIAALGFIGWAGISAFRT